MSDDSYIDGSVGSPHSPERVHFPSEFRSSTNGADDDILTYSTHGVVEVEDVWGRSLDVAQRAVIDAITEMGNGYVEFDQLIAWDRAHSKLRKLRNKAIIGDAESLFDLGCQLYQGRYPFRRNQVEALRLFVEGAAAGSTKCYNNVAVMMVNEDIIIGHRDLGIELLDSLAADGDVVAAGNLGVVYSSGDFGELNYELAVTYYELALDGNVSLAFNNLGCMYNRGLGVTVNFKHGMRLLKRASRLGCDAANYNMGVMYINGMGVRANFKKGIKLMDKCDQSGTRYLTDTEMMPDKFMLLTSLHLYVST
jgi:hypothetical protein